MGHQLPESVSGQGDFSSHSQKLEERRSCEQLAVWHRKAGDLGRIAVVSSRTFTKDVVNEGINE